MTSGLWMLRRRASERHADHAFLAVASLLFAASTTLTIVWCVPMSAMAGMLMPGGWTMSMAWMPTPEQTWAGAATTLPADAGTAWRHGVRLGVHCSYCSAGLTAILVMGVMDLRVMALVTTAITAERLAPAGERVARGIGVIVVCAGVLVLARAAGFQWRSRIARERDLADN